MVNLTLIQYEEWIEESFLDSLQEMSLYTNHIDKIGME